jgi:uncharacterized protein (DUF2141 family)
MIKRKLSVVIFQTAMCIFLHAQESVPVGNLKVVVLGLKNDRGEVRIGLFNSIAGYQGKTGPFRGSSLPIENRQATWTVEQLPFGEYAIKLFHDEDKDNRIKRNFLGFPTESVGFSNNAKIRFGLPGFDKTRFVFNSKEMTVVIQL